MTTGRLENRTDFQTKRLEFETISFRTEIQTEISRHRSIESELGHRAGLVVVFPVQQDCLALPWLIGLIDVFAVALVHDVLRVGISEIERSVVPYSSLNFHNEPASYQAILYQAPFLSIFPQIGETR